MSGSSQSAAEFNTERLYQEIWNAVAVEMRLTVSPTLKRDIGGTSGERIKAVIHRHDPTVDPDAYIAAALAGTCLWSRPSSLRPHCCRPYYASIRISDPR